MWTAMAVVKSLVLCREETRADPAHLSVTGAALTSVLAKKTKSVRICILPHQQHLRYFSVITWIIDSLLRVQSGMEAQVLMVWQYTNHAPKIVEVRKFNTLSYACIFTQSNISFFKSQMIGLLMRRHPPQPAQPKEEEEVFRWQVFLDFAFIFRLVFKNAIGGGGSSSVGHPGWLSLSYHRS